jgi:NADPH:quinone reductase-like Zn-dependent oxidoreductase
VLGWAAQAAYAEHVVINVDQIVAKPAAMPWAEAGVLSASGQTAATALAALEVGPQDTLLIHAAAGGVGSFAVQLARASGATVIGTASERNHDFLRSLGAEPTTYGPGLAERVRALAPAGVDLGFDTAGKGGVRELIELTGDPARVASIADFGAAELGVKVTGGAGSERSVEALAEAAGLIEAGRFQLPVAETFRFEQAAEAHRVSEEGHVRGKLVLVP